MLCDQSGHCPQPDHPHASTLATSAAPHLPAAGLPADSSSSLDTHESTPHLPGRLYHSFRHSGWQRQRSAVFEALTSLGLGTSHPTSNSLAPQGPRNVVERPPQGERSVEYESALGRFVRCGSDAWVLRSAEEPPRYRLASNRCRSRWCVPCQAERGRLIATNIHDNLPNVRLRFATLTVKSRDVSLSDALDHLLHSFARLRRSRLWRDHVRGGLTVLETSYNTKTQQWHPHLHVLWEGNFLPQDRLSQTWHAATGDSWVVDVRRVRSLTDVTNYLTKYLTKSLSKRIWHDRDRLAEAILTLHGRKLISCFGTWHRLRLLTPPDPTGEWFPLCSADRLLELVLRKDDDALRIASSLFKRSLVDWMKEHPP